MGKYLWQKKKVIMGKYGDRKEDGISITSKSLMI